MSEQHWTRHTLNERRRGVSAVRLWYVFGLYEIKCHLHCLQLGIKKVEVEEEENIEEEPVKKGKCETEVRGLG